MTGTALTVAGVTSLASKELTVELFNIINAINEGNKSAWDIAIAYSKIIDEELFDEDFETIEDFANYVGVSKSLISQYTRAVKFMQEHELPYDTFTVVSAYHLSKFTDEEFTDFVKWCEEQEINISSLSVRALINLIKEYNNPVEEMTVEEVNEAQQENEATENEATEDEEIDREGVILMILNTMAEHNISIEELQERI